jgi:hypothetical protein
MWVPTWLALSDSGLRSDMEREHENCLDMLNASVGRGADRPP